MKTFLRSFIALLLGAFILTSGIYAQDEKSVVQVKIIKDGKTIMDTTYLVEDESSTKMAVKMLDIALGEKSVEKGKKVYAFSSEEGENHEWISQDGKRQMIREKVYISSEDCDGEYVTVEVDGDGNRTIHKKVIVKKGDDGNKVKKANEVIIIKKEAAEPAEIEWIEKGEPKLLIIDDGGKEKTIKVLKL